MKTSRYLLVVFGLIFTLFSRPGYSQLTLSADSVMCGATSTTLHATLLGDVPTSAGITSDDGYSSLISIGFNFKFYNNYYNRLCIGSNGILNFNSSVAGAYCPWPISAVLAGNSSVYNCFCGPWCDIYIPAGGTITYSTIGTAPYRKFMATFCATRMYSCTTQWTTTQMILYETTNILEAHIAHKTICSWNGGQAIVGVQNASGSASTAAPSRDYGTSWTATNEAWRFSPRDTTISGYSVSSISFAPVPYSSSTICWYDSTTGAFLGTGTSITVSPTGGVGTYYATAAGCADSTFAYIHVDLHSDRNTAGHHINSISATNPTVCGKCDGTIHIAGGLSPGVSDTVYYSKDGIPMPPMVFPGGAGADSSLTMTGLCAGVYDAIHVQNGNPCPSNTVGPITLVDPPINADFTITKQLGCTSDRIIITNRSTPAGYHCDWTYGDGSGDTVYNPVHTYTTQNNYTVRLIYSTYGTCFDTLEVPIDLRHPESANFTPSATQVCLGTAIDFTNSSIAGRPDYMWDFGDGTTSTLDNPSHTYSKGGYYKVTLNVTDSIPCLVTKQETVEVIEVNAHVPFKDTIVCLRRPMEIDGYADVLPNDNTVTLSYLWTPAAGLSSDNTATTFFSGTGVYIYRFTAVTTPLGCSSTVTAKINSQPPIVLTNITPTQYITNGGSVQLNAENAWIYEWFPNDGSIDNPNINNPIAHPNDSVTVYTVVGQNEYGCKDTATVTVHLNQDVRDMIPTAFTPNDDGLNDEFRLIKFTYQKLVDFKIFDRWGNLMFETADYKKGWDGKFKGVPQDMGEYFYQIIVAYPEGMNKTVNGSFTLIR